jgi:TDG/mug DNA glycosylase family protein
MARFTRAELESFRDATVPDLVGPGLRLLFVGINPGLWTAAVQTHFARPGNRFYPALQQAGIVDRRIDPGAGMTDDDRPTSSAVASASPTSYRVRPLEPTS